MTSIELPISYLKIIIFIIRGGAVEHFVLKNGGPNYGGAWGLIWVWHIQILFEKKFPKHFNADLSISYSASVGI